MAEKIYIELDEIVDTINARRDSAAARKDLRTMHELNCLMDVINDRDCIPAADVAPVVHGHWIKTNLMFASSQTGRHGNVHVCSNCGEQSGFGFATPYCAICGAKMDKEG